MVLGARSNCSARSLPRQRMGTRVGSSSQMRLTRRPEAEVSFAAHEALIHWCETLITAHADRVELQAWVGGEDRDSVD